MVAKIDGTNGVLQQYDYQTPTTGFSYTFAAGTTVLVMNPAGTLATGTITMPAAPVDGMTISFSSTQQITALTVAANTGQSIVGQPTTMLAGGAATFVYRLSNTTWYAQTNTAGLGTTSGAPVLNSYTSPGTWTKPATCVGIKVTVVGGGGSGGSATGGASTPGTYTGQSGSGGGGGYAQKVYPAPSLSGPQPYTVGSAASSSSFGVAPATVVTATGGVSSSPAVAPGPSPVSTSPGAGGSGSNGDVNIPGGPGIPTPVGIGGGTSVLSTFGNARLYGGGGLGATQPGPGTTPGTTGATGIVIIEEFY